MQETLETKKNGGFLGAIERVGNKLPHPVLLFVYFCAAVILLSFLGALLGWSAVHPVDGTVCSNDTGYGIAARSHEQHCSERRKDHKSCIRSTAGCNRYECYRECESFFRHLDEVLAKERAGKPRSLKHR